MSSDVEQTYETFAKLLDRAMSHTEEYGQCFYQNQHPNVAYNKGD